jgi:tyrosinase
MKTNNGIGIRRSIQDLQNDYAKGDKKPLEDVMRAWKGIKELPPDNPKSFFRLAGFHGEPFRGAGWGSPNYWGGYCNHGNVLFPTWHRVYLVKLQEALQSIPGCENVMLPFWDETSEDSLANGIPWALTQKDFVRDGMTVPNPLRSFVFNKEIVDHVSPDPQGADYGKPGGYETVRYPLSGIVQGPDKAKTERHNKNYPNYDENVKLLNRNVVNWLTSQIVVHDTPRPTNLRAKYLKCLDAPNYTVFSNTTSRDAWNDDLPTGSQRIESLESPHNSIHLAVGGFDVPNLTDFSPIEGANGDMGENDTAAFDPIFFFHHCFVDRLFWLWQKRHGFTEHLEVMPEFPGTNSVDGQNPTPGMVPNTWLTLDSPLNPFKKNDGGVERAYTSIDCIHIEKQLGYTYGAGSLEEKPIALAAAVVPGASSKMIRVSGINRASIRGSFLISAYVNLGGKKYHVGTEAVLSRWNVQYCANCQTHLEAKAFIGLHAFQQGSIENAEYEIQIRTRDGMLNHPQASPSPLSIMSKKSFHMEIR